MNGAPLIELSYYKVQTECEQWLWRANKDVANTELVVLHMVHTPTAHGAYPHCTCMAVNDILGECGTLIVG